MNIRAHVRRQRPWWRTVRVLLVIPAAVGLVWLAFRPEQPMLDIERLREEGLGL